MTAYPFPAASPAPPAATTADPTAVMGRRIGAFLIDFLLYVLVMAFVGPTPLSPLAEYYEVPDSAGDVCSDVRDADDDVLGCLQLGDRVYVTSGGDFAVQAVVWVAFVGLYAAMQGATGLTPGKAVFGVKVVNEQGGKPGFGRGLGRTLLWIVDAAPWCFPLVGLITGLTTKGHRHVGDMAAKTFVVDKAHTGPVIVPGLTTGATGPYGPSGGPGAPWGTPPGGSGPPTWGAPAQPQAPWGGPPSGGFPPPGATGPSTPAGPPTVHRPSPPTGAPAATPAGPPPGAPASGATAAGPPAASRPAPPADAPSTAAPSGAPAAPSARGTAAGPPAGPGSAPRDEPSRPAPSEGPAGASPAGQAPSAEPGAAAAPGSRRGPSAPRGAGLGRPAAAARGHVDARRDRAGPVGLQPAVGRRPRHLHRVGAPAGPVARLGRGLPPVATALTL